jgi:hypothetical protein
MQCSESLRAWRMHIGKRPSPRRRLQRGGHAIAAL